MQEKAEIVISDLAQDTVDTFFEASDKGVMTVTPDAGTTLDTDAESTRFWTLSEAADNLGLSSRTILRRLKSGALKGTKVQGPNGPEWRISPVTASTSTTTDTATTVRTVTADAVPTDDRTLATLVKVIADQSEQLRLQAEHLQAATYLIQNQQNQIAEQAMQIALLEDKRRHRKWWQRAAAWFGK